MFTPRVSDDVRATRLASKLMRFCVSGDALETMRAAPPEPPATTRLNAPLGVFSMGAPLVSSGRNCICPEICCRASRCWLPKARAFAVRVTSRMDPRVVGGVSATVLSPARWAYPVTAIPRDVLLLGPVRVERPHVVSAVHDAHWRVNAASRTLQYQGVRVRLHCISLARAERSRICSERGIRHECGGGRRCSLAGFPHRLSSPLDRCSNHRCRSLAKRSSRRHPGLESCGCEL